MDGEQTSTAEATVLEEIFYIKENVDAYLKFNSFNIEFEGDSVPDG